MTTHYQKDATTAVCGIRCAAPFNTTNPADVTCKRCLKAMAAEHDAKMVAAIPLLNDTSEPVVEPVASKNHKPNNVNNKAATIHLHDMDRHPTYQTWCKIPGQHSPDPADVTCKVCRAHIDGKAPLNAVPERVKQARKAFRSFVARVAYMVFMDRDCGGDNGINWSLSHTNMAGDCYEVGRSNTTGYRVMCNASIVTTDLGQDIKQWMEEHWSCGEEK